MEWLTRASPPHLSGWLRLLYAELYVVERRLWPLAALLVLGLVAVPVLLLRPAPAALEQTAAPVASAAPAAPAAAGATPAAAPASADAALADPSVALTSSPFAAAFGSGLNLPPAMEGLLKSTKGADFDREYMKTMIEDHQKALKEFESNAKTRQDEELRNVLNRALPRVREHLKHAQQIARDLK